MFKLIKRDKYKEKIFCIGVNKSGTTTMEQTLKDLGYKLGNQRKGENLMEDWAVKRFDRIIKLSKSADAFQDIPFSLPFTYVPLDQYFKNSKFILTVRNSEEQYFHSVTRYHSNLWGSKNGVPPSEYQLKNAKYIYKGRPFRQVKLQFNAPNNNLYKKDLVLDYYRSHNKNVLHYFRNRPNKLIVVNVAEKNDYFRLCEFLEKDPVADKFPWLHKTNR